MAWLRFDDDHELTRILLCPETGANFRLLPDSLFIEYEGPSFNPDIHANFIGKNYEDYITAELQFEALCKRLINEE